MKSPIKETAHNWATDYRVARDAKSFDNLNDLLEIYFGCLGASINRNNEYPITPRDKELLLGIFPFLAELQAGLSEGVADSFEYIVVADSVPAAQDQKDTKRKILNMGIIDRTGRQSLVELHYDSNYLQDVRSATRFVVRTGISGSEGEVVERYEVSGVQSIFVPIISYAESTNSMFDSSYFSDSQ